MQWIALLIGAFYACAGAFAIAAARSSERAVNLLHGLTGDRGPTAAGTARQVVLLAGVVMLSGGAALVMLSRWAAPIFIAGMLMQTGYLLYVSRVLPPEDEQQTIGRRRTVTALYMYAAATAVVLWLESEGVLR